MADIEVLFRTHLAGNARVAALVGNKIYPTEAPQDAAFPYIVYQTIDRTEAIVKPTHATLRLARKRIQVDGYTKGTRAYSAMKNLEAAIITAAYTFTSSVNGAIVQTRVVDSMDSHEADEEVYRVSIDVSVLFNE